MLADVPARAARARPRGLLHRRHRRVRVRPGAEHARHRSRVRHDLHPPGARAVRPGRSLVVRELRRHATTGGAPRRSGATPRAPTCSSTCRAVRGSGATSTRASRARSSSTRTRRSRSSPSRRPSRGTSSSSAASIASSRSDRTSARPRRRFRSAISPGTRRGSRSRSTTGARTSRRATASRSVMTWQIESFADVGGNKDQEFVRVHRSAARTTQPFELAINGPQALLREHGWDTVDAMGASAHAVGLPRVHPAVEGRVRRRQAHLRRRRAPAGSAIAPSVISRPAGRRSCRTRAGRRTCRPATACSPSRPRGSARRHRAHQPRLPAHARRAADIAREHFDANVVLPRLLDEALS